VDVGLAPVRSTSLLARLRSVSALQVAALVTAFYAISFASALAHHRAADFAWVGRTFVERPGSSRVIADHAVPTREIGYDGQFALFIALDPAHAAPSIDGPPYRYSHILFPLAARTLALGNDAWVPAAMLLVNVLAVFFGTLALGLILRRERLPAAWAASFACFPGVLIAFDRDVGDLLAYSLVAVGVLALRWGVPRRVLLAGVVFALAGLARESTLFFPAVLSLAHLLEREQGSRTRRAEAVVLATIAAVPYAVWRLFLLAWLGPSNSFPPSGLAPYPFAGVVEQGWRAATAFNLLCVVVPGVLVAVVALRAARRATWWPFPVCLAIQLAVFVVFLPPDSYADYTAAGRLQIGAVVAALCCAPVLSRVAALDRRLLTVTLGLAFAPSLFFLPLLAGTPV
jgi:hypothetical protein